MPHIICISILSPHKNSYVAFPQLRNREKKIKIIHSGIIEDEKFKNLTGEILLQVKK
jgi:hypothetical protein